MKTPILKLENNIMKTTIKELKKEGYIGPDASLRESLEEYHIAWKDDGDDLKFIYKTNFDLYDWACFSKNLNIEKEFDWVDWDAFLSYVGEANIENFKKIPLGIQIQSLMNYYGVDNIFGSGFHGSGFLIDFED
jgi:hypothetical protein